MLSYDLFPDNKKRLRKMFSAILDLKKLIEYKIYFFEKSVKDRISHFNISVTVKRRSVDEPGKT